MSDIRKRCKLHPQSIESIRMRLARIGKEDLLDHILEVQEKNNLPVSTICIFIDEHEEIIKKTDAELAEAQKALSEHIKNI